MFLLTGFLFIIGLFVGSFLGVLIDRIPQNKSFIKGRSHCDNCKKTLKWYDLVPVLSFVLLRGKCRYCNTKLTFFYPFIEVLTGTLFALSYIVLIHNLPFGLAQGGQFWVNLVYYLVMISSFIVIFFIDLRNGIIPDKILVFDTALTFVWLLFNLLAPQNSALQNGVGLILNHLLSAFASFAFFIAIVYIFYFLTKKQGMGGGDVKLSFVLGLFLGFPNILISLYLSFLIGAAYALLLLLFRKSSLKSTLPFGPFLILGVFLAIFFQNQLYEIAIKVLGF